MASTVFLYLRKAQFSPLCSSIVSCCLCCTLSSACASLLERCDDYTGLALCNKYPVLLAWIRRILGSEYMLGIILGLADRCLRVALGILWFSLCCFMVSCVIVFLALRIACIARLFSYLSRQFSCLFPLSWQAGFPEPYQFSYWSLLFLLAMLPVHDLS